MTRVEGLEIRKDSAAQSAAEAEAIRVQLGNVLGSHHFRNSRRSQAFLRFVVDAAIDGHHDLLKERHIGITVFGRENAYDTAQDAVVRNAAVEVRKRLAQYYLEPEHAGELRIELPAGSYVPMFPGEAAAAEGPAAEVAKIETPAAPPRRHRRALLWTAAIAAVLALAAAITGAMMRRSNASEMEAFWAPLFRNHEVIQVCVGQPRRLYRFTGPRSATLDQTIIDRTTPGAGDPKAGEHLSIAASELTWVAPQYLYMRDAFAMTKVVALIQSHGAAYQMLPLSNTSYSRLRRSPVVAIGAFDNPWVIRVTESLRYVFDHKMIGGIQYLCVTDRQKPGDSPWMIAEPLGFHLTEDYAVVSRVVDPTTERTVISVAGLDSWGTLAAGEFVSDPEYLGATLRAASRDWRRKNVQIVLRTKIIDGMPGPPAVLATYFW